MTRQREEFLPAWQQRKAAGVGLLGIKSGCLEVRPLLLLQASSAKQPRLHCNLRSQGRGGSQPSKSQAGGAGRGAQRARRKSKEGWKERGAAHLRQLLTTPALATWSSLEVIRFFIEKQPDNIIVKGRLGRLPLSRAAECPRAAVMELLIDLHPGATSAVDSHGALPIHIAASHGATIGTVQLLLSHHHGTHSGLNHVDNGGNTPLHDSVFLSAPVPTVHLLLERHPEATGMFNEDGRLPIHLVCLGYRQYPLDLYRLLLDFDLFSVLKTSRGQTPLELISRSHEPGTEVWAFLAQRQDEAVRLMRDTLLGFGEERGLPDLVVSTVCSFVLPRILSPTRDEITW